MLQVERTGQACYTRRGSARGLGKGGDMAAIVGMAEFISCVLVTSAIAWLRHLRGAPRMAHDFEIRYVAPVSMSIIVVLAIFLGVHEQRRGEFHPDSSPPAVGMALGLGVVLVALVVWLMVEVGRYRTHRRGVSRSNQSYSHNPSSQRRPKRGRSKNRTR